MLNRGEFFRYRLNDRWLTVRREEKDFIVLEPVSFKTYSLTPAQAEVLALLAEGHGAEQVSELISPGARRDEDFLVRAVKEFETFCRESRLL